MATAPMCGKLWHGKVPCGVCQSAIVDGKDEEETVASGFTEAALAFHRVGTWSFQIVKNHSSVSPVPTLNSNVKLSSLRTNSKV